MNRTKLSFLVLCLLALTSLINYAAQPAHEPYTPQNTIQLFDVDEVLVRRTMSVKDFLWEHMGTLLYSLPIGHKLLPLYCRGASASEFIKVCEDAGYKDTANAIRNMLLARVIMPGMTEFIEARKKEGYELHIATNQFQEGMDTYIKMYPEFFKNFDFIYVGTPAHGDTKALQKPDVDYYNDYLAKRPKPTKPHTFFWDDRTKNVAGARKAGIDGAVFTDAEQAENDFKKNFSGTPTTCDEKHPEIIMP
ncbi:MAG: HAD hydrolase-like protein [Candidatus Babeliales bacterium]